MTLVDQTMQQASAPPVPLAPVRRAPSAPQSVNSSTDKANDIVQSRFSHGMSAFEGSFQMLLYKNFEDMHKKDHLNAVDLWVLSFLMGIAEGSISEVKEHFVHLPLLKLKTQISLLTEAKNLAQKMVDGLSDNNTNEDHDALSILPLIDKKLQEAQERNPKLAPEFPLKTKNEIRFKKFLSKIEDIRNNEAAQIHLKAGIKELEAVVKDIQAKQKDKEPKQTAKDKITQAIYEVATTVGPYAGLFGAFYLTGKILGKGVLVLGTVIIITNHVYHSTIVIKADGTEPSVWETLRIGFGARIRFGIQDIVSVFQK